VNDKKGGGAMDHQHDPSRRRARPVRQFTHVVLALLAMLAGCQKPDETTASPQPVITGERIALPRDGKQAALLKSAPAEALEHTTAAVPGRLTWNEDRTARVFSPMGGRVVAMRAAPGNAVRAGQALATVSSPDFGQAQADVRRAATDLALAQKNLARAQELHAAGVIAEKDLQAAQADQARALAEQERTLAREKLYGRGGGSVDQQFRLNAPIGGVIVERNLNPGQEVRPDQAQPGNPALFVITDPTSLWAQIELPEALLGAVRPGTGILLRSGAFPGGEFPARVDYVADAIDPASRTLKARASLANPDRRLKAEMFVTAEVPLPTDAAPRVPSSAVLLVGNRQYAFVDEGDYNYTRRPVTADETRLGQMRVKTGIRPGEKVVVEGGLLLQQILAARSQR
jgi:cobalt-zinc-cadmium efflux system membrane fusion protein